MTLQSSVAAIIAGCVHVPQLPYFQTDPADGYQLKVVYGVNKLFWRTWNDLVLDWVCPSPPAVVIMRFYEHFDAPPSTDPLIEISGYLATCAQPAPGLGTSAWLWMATLNYFTTGQLKVSPLYIHVQYKNTNVGSIGLIRYPTTPPT